MFRWYRNADFCYVYLEDVAHLSDTADAPEDKDRQFRQARWFTRGWTLQELIAPPIVHVFDRSWNFIGSRTSLRSLISDITGIDSAVFDTGDLSRYSIAQKMSWASGRNTTRTEDLAYCLLGLFGISMPLLYGEGTGAFRRLQEEIIRRTDDYSIFAHCSYDNRILASLPSDFKNCRSVRLLDVAKTLKLDSRGQGVTISSVGIHVTLPMLPTRPSSPRFYGVTEWPIVGSVWPSATEERHGADFSVTEVVVVELLQKDASGLYVRSSRSSTPETLSISAETQIAEKTCVLRHNALDQVEGWEQDRSRFPGLMLQVHGDLRDSESWENPPPRLKLEYIDCRDYDVQTDANGSYHLTVNPKTWQARVLPVAFLIGFNRPVTERALLVILTPTVRSIQMLVLDRVRIISAHSDLGNERDLVYQKSKNVLSVSLRDPPSSTDRVAYEARHGGRKPWVHKRFHLEVGQPHRGSDNTTPTGMASEGVTVACETSQGGGKMYVSVNAKRKPGRWHVSVSSTLRSTESNPRFPSATTSGKLSLDSSSGIQH
jgi:hypothetical protein